MISLFYFSLIFYFENLKPTVIVKPQHNKHPSLHLKYQLLIFCLIYLISIPNCLPSSLLHIYMCVCVYICKRDDGSMYVYIYIHTHTHINIHLFIYFISLVALKVSDKHHVTLLFFFKFIYSAAPGLSYGIFSCGLLTLNCSVWDLVP